MRLRLKDKVLSAIIFTAVVVTALGVALARHDFSVGKRAPAWGVTFSNQYATSLGLDWKEVYIAALDDLAIKHLRLVAYWDDIEPEPGEYYFDDLDWELAQAQHRGASVILAIGRRVPRWPECHVPNWAQGKSEPQVQQRILDMLSVVVTRYKSNPAIIRWQVENEPLFGVFGVCPPPDSNFLAKEIALVRSLDARPIMLTDSGELSTWYRLGHRADVLGVSLYRVTWNKFWGYFYYPIPPAYYVAKAALFTRAPHHVIISELQTEAWGSESLKYVPLNEQFRSMSPARMKANIDFARRTGIGEIYLWGVEWWYWLNIHGVSDFWDIARDLYNH